MNMSGIFQIQFAFFGIAINDDPNLDRIPSDVFPTQQPTADRSVDIVTDTDSKTNRLCVQMITH